MVVVQPACSSVRASATGPRLDLGGRQLQHLQDRHGVSAADRVVLERGLEGGIRQLVDAQRAHQRVTADLLEEGGTSRDDPGLRPPHQLVAAEAHDIGSLLEAVRDDGLVMQRFEMPIALGPSEPAAAEILGNRHAELASDRNQLAERRTFCEALDAEVGWMDAQNQRGPLADRCRHSRRRASGWSCPPPGGSPQTGPSRPARGSHRQSRRAHRGRSRPRGRSRARRASTAWPRRCC